MNWDLDQLLSYPPIMGVTINTVTLSPAFRSMLYFLIVLVFVGAMIVHVMRAIPFRRAFASAVLATFFTAAVVSALQADIGWCSWLIVDEQKFGGRTTDEKLAVLEGPLYEVIRNIRRIVRDDYALFSEDDYVRQRTEYFLLPLRKRERADNIIVLEDRLARFDPASGIFTRGEITIGHLKPVYAYGPNIYVLRKE